MDYAREDLEMDLSACIKRGREMGLEVLAIVEPVGGGPEDCTCLTQFEFPRSRVLGMLWSWLLKYRAPADGLWTDLEALQIELEVTNGALEHLRDLLLADEEPEEGGG